MVKDLRAKLKLAFSDHCTIPFPWIYLGPRGSCIRKCHRFAFRAALHQDRNFLRRTRLEKAAHVLGGILWPLSLVSRSALIAPRLIRLTKTDHEIGVFRQYLDMLLFGLRYNIPPKAYYKYELFLDKGDLGRPWDYLHDHEMPYILKAIRATLDDVANGIDDKLLFSEHCLEHGIAVQSNIVLAKKSRVMWCRGNEKLPASDLVIKRTHLAGGQGVEVWEFAEKDRTWTRDGREFDEAGFLNHVSKSAADEDLIVQARLRNEKTIRDLVGPGLSTIRVLSARYRDEHPFVVAATMRMPVGGNLVDNLSGGGIAANVCLESGIVRKAVSRDIQDGWITTHPDSGLSIEGFQIPDLQQATDLCVKAHAEFGNYPAIGWDAVITEAGPLLLEGNTLWGQELHQETPGNIALGSTKLLAILADSIPSTDSAASAP